MIPRSTFNQRLLRGKAISISVFRRFARWHDVRAQLIGVRRVVPEIRTGDGMLV